MTPNTGNAGASVSVSLTNLTGAALAMDNPGILVSNVLTAPTTLTATFPVKGVSNGGANFFLVSFAILTVILPSGTHSSRNIKT